MVSQTAPTLFVDSRRTESPTITSNSSSPNPSEPESHRTTSLDVDPAVMNSYGGDNHKFELPPLDPVATNFEKEVKIPNVGVEIPNGDFMVTIDSPTGPLPNPYETDASQTEPADYSWTRGHNFASLSSSETGNEDLHRLPSVLRPAHPRFFDTTESRRASMSLEGQGYGLPPLPSTGGKRSMVSDGSRSFASDERFASAGRKSFASVGRGSFTSEDDMRPFPTNIGRPHTIVGDISISTEIGVPFSSVDGGLSVPEFEGERMRRHSAVDVSSTTLQQYPQHPPFSFDSLPVETSRSEGDAHPENRTDQTAEEQQLADPHKSVPKHSLNKKPSRWRFWSRKKSNSAKA